MIMLAKTCVILLQNHFYCSLSDFLVVHIIYHVHIFFKLFLILWSNYFYKMRIKLDLTMFSQLQNVLKSFAFYDKNEGTVVFTYTPLNKITANFDISRKNFIALAWLISISVTKNDVLTLITAFDGNLCIYNFFNV